ncbi:MAG: VCBS repeat-containing protein [Saprospiraceae bacterium]|nr:VCBS repeat-containing protein [Saprospiraceae bacterium]
MKKGFLPTLALLVATATSQAQIQFINKTALLTPNNHYSGVAIAVLDMDGDGRDDIVRMNQGYQMAVEFQMAPNQPFVRLPIGLVGSDPDDSQWGICAGDLDNNGFPDVLTGGAYDGIKVAMANASASAYTLKTLTAPGTFVQCVNFADINNDGWLDAFVCHDDGTSRIFGNDGAGNLALQPGWMNLATVPPSDNSGNYGSVWSDVNNDGYLDLYIAKCRTGVNSPNDGRRINQLFLNNGNGTYSQDTTNASGLRIGAQSWTADFGDIDNDGDMDCFITNHDVSSQLLDNDGTGHFTDITMAAGLFNMVGGLPIQGIFRDFDNDGFVDILVSGTVHYLLRNNGDKTFSVVTGLFDNNQIESVAVGDLNHDGFMDIYAGYANIYTEPSDIPDALWLNAGNDNNFFGLTLRGVQSNRSAVGAKVQLHSALGTQTREVRAGESYGIMNSMQIHFGMGQLTTIDSVKVYWPSGTVDALYSPAVNQYLTLEEGGCIVPPVVAYSDGPATICAGQSVVLNVADAYNNYLWSNGVAASPSVTIGASGNYRVTVTNSEGCTAVSNIVMVVVDPDETPVLALSGDTIFCNGASITLTSSLAASYLWSTGDTTQSITVSQSGAYSVAIQGQCASFSSAPVTVAVLDNPPPVATGDTIAPNTSAILTATGDQIAWYDASAGGNLLFEGSPFITPPLDANTTYWVANTTIYDEPNQFVGMENYVGTVPIGDVNFNGAIVFDCHVPFRLAKVKVYANNAGVRKIDLRNENGTIIQSKSVNIPVGTTVITLDLDVPIGNNLVLTTDENVNIANLSSLGPRLYRSTQDVSYPYVIPNVVSIKGSNFGPLRYFYFFNWEIDFYDYRCTSARVPVLALVDSTLSAGIPAWAEGLRLYPNPASSLLIIEMDKADGGELMMSVLNAQGVRLQSRNMRLYAGPNSFQNDLSALPRGIYWLEFAMSDGVVRRKILVQ